MSIHSSLKISGKLTGERNVWTRVERLAALRKGGLWQEGDAVTGLPKVRTRFKVKTKKTPKAETAAAAGTEGAAATTAAAAGADKKPAAAGGDKKAGDKKGGDKKAGDKK